MRNEERSSLRQTTLQDALHCCLSNSNYKTGDLQQECTLKFYTLESTFLVRKTFVVSVLLYVNQIVDNVMIFQQH